MNYFRMVVVQWRQRAKAAIIFGLAIVTLTFLAITTHKWDAENESYTSWIKSGEASFCEKIRQDCARDVNRNAEAAEKLNSYDTILRAESCEERRLSEISGKKSIACYYQDPGSLRDYLLNAAMPAIAPLAAISALVSALLYVLLLTISLYITELNVGWRRLSIVVAIVVSAIAPIIFLFNIYRITDEDVLTAVAMCVGGFATAILAVLGGYRVYSWVRGGFLGEASPGDGMPAELAPIAMRKDSTRLDGNRHDAVAEAVSSHHDVFPERLLALPLASPWRRFFARWIDLWLLSFPVSLAMALLFSAITPAFQIWAQKPGSSFTFGWICLPFVMYAEAIVFAVFGNTPGKALFRTCVVTELGEHPTFKKYLHRQLGVYWYGLGTGFPLIAFITVLAQYLNVKQGVQPQYDRNQFSVRARPVSSIQVFVNVVLMFGLIFLYGLGIELLRKM